MMPTPDPQEVTPLETLRRLQLPDLELAYDVTTPEHGIANDAVPVLLCMGAMLPGHAWRFIVPELAAERRVAWFDNRGTGASGAPPGPYRMQQLAADAGALLDHLGWTRAHLVGVSMGGMVAQELALSRRERIASLTLIATHPGGLRYRLPRLRALPLMMRMFLGTPTNRARLAVSLLFPRAYRDAVGRARLEAILARDFHPPISPSGRRGQVAAALGHDTRARLGQLATLPTLIVKPERDLVIAPRSSDALRRLIPGAELLSFADAGHGIIRQHPRELGAALRAHFARAEGRG